MSVAKIGQLQQLRINLANALSINKTHLKHLEIQTEETREADAVRRVRNGIAPQMLGEPSR